MKEVTKQAEETQISHKTLRLLAGTLCSVIGTLLAIYVGCLNRYRVLWQPILQENLQLAQLSLQLLNVCYLQQ